MIEKNVSLLVGFPTSHESMLLGKAAREKNILAISAASKHSDLAKQGGNIFSINSSNDSMVNTSLNFIKKKFANKRGLLITNPYNVYSVNLFKLYKQKNYQLSYTKLNKSLELAPSVLKDLEQKKYDFIILNTYVMKSLKVLDQINRLPKKLPIVSNSAWVIEDIRPISRILSNYGEEVFSIGVYDEGSKAFRSFREKAKNYFGTFPSPLMAYGYDLGVVTREILERIKGPINKETVLKAFKSNLCFKNTIMGTLCFPKSGGQSLRPHFMVKFDKNKGFIRKYKR